MEIAKKAAQKGREVLEKYYKTPLSIRTKNTQHYNLVTQADVECEKAITEVILAQCPGHNILAEEHEYGKTGSEYTWIIDPLDGTTNFAHGLPVWSISIALALRGELITGLVWDITRDEQFTAIKDNGAFCNEEAIRVSKAGRLTESLFSIGFYYDRGEAMKRSLKKIEELLVMGITDIRRFGSAALDLCWVACGRIDGYFEYMLNPWDFAAGKLILSEAGGQATTYEGGETGIKPSSMAATNGLIHNELVAFLKKP